MIKFFRKIRQNLLSEGKTGKYFKYAIGEIVLVVIGILIALSINNWNEERQKEKQITTILKEIQKDIEEDVFKSKELFTYYEKRDSIIQLALSNKLEREDYLAQNNYLYIFVAMNAFHLKIHDNGYKKLTDNLDNIPDQYQDLIAPLNEMYIYNKYEIDKFDTRIDKVTDRLIDKLAATKPWYYKLRNSIFPEDAIHYFLNDTIYKNDLDTYSNAAYNLQNHIVQFSQNACHVYKTIAERTGYPKIIPDFIPHNLIEPTAQELEAITGNYSLVKVTSPTGEVMELDLPIQIKHGKYGLELIDVESNEKFYLFYKDSTTLFDENDTYDIIKNDNDKITGIIQNSTYGTAELKKID